jgi:tetratricopeptide (TPR) repeat protein
MKKFSVVKIIPTCILIFLLLLCFTFTTNAHETINDQLELGTVNFPISCNEQAVTLAGRGLALMHHMTYEDARASFNKAAKADKNCGMAYWGAAMTYIHPLWSDPPSKDEYDTVRALLDQAKKQGQKTDWENDYIGALETYLSSPWSKNEKPRLERFAKAWEEIYLRYPDDIEAAAFYALTFLSTADPGDKTYSKQLESGEIANKILFKHKDHPGGHHYVIHSYDYSTLAKKAIEVANNYGKIAPEIPHALHMPTHIFTREGMWQESIEGNSRSAEAALKSPVKGAVSLHYLHALDYLAYAYLQTGQDQKAQQVQITMQAIDGPIQAHVASAYALAAVPARIALERQQWKAAAKLETRNPKHYSWDNTPAMEAITYFARALGAAKNGYSEQAHEDIAKLEELKKKLPESAEYWATQIEIQRLTALAWLQYQSDSEQGLKTMIEAAELEASTEKHPVTPGEILPAHELLADMLFDLGQYEDALVKYQAALTRSPNRLNSLYGAGMASEKIGDGGLAKNYYQQLLTLTREADTSLSKVEYAKEYLSSLAAL